MRLTYSFPTSQGFFYFFSFSSSFPSFFVVVFLLLMFFFFSGVQVHFLSVVMLASAVTIEATTAAKKIQDLFGFFLSFPPPFFLPSQLKFFSRIPQNPDSEAHIETARERKALPTEKKQSFSLFLVFLFVFFNLQSAIPILFFLF